MSAANIVVLAGFVIGLIYGSVGLLSGFCMMSSLCGWWALASLVAVAGILAGAAAGLRGALRVRPLAPA